MNKDDVTKRLAPCGLDCGRCLNHPESPISRLAGELKKELGGFGERAAFFAKLDPAFAGYPAFEAVLDRFANAACSGCRTGKCLLGDCVPQRCVTEKGVDYCFQCASFPCATSGLEGPLKERWLQNNLKMREMGLEAFFALTLPRPRY
jgi:hypothetical protein